MITDSLQSELFVNSPTFRRQVSNALTNVGVARWKAATATILMVDAAIQAGTATTEQQIARSLAQTEKTFLENALAVQGVNLTGAAQSFPAMGGDPTKEGTTRMINMLLAHTSWTWTVADWLENQASAAAEIEARMNELLASLTAAPTQQ